MIEVQFSKMHGTGNSFIIVSDLSNIVTQKLSRSQPPTSTSHPKSHVHNRTITENSENLTPHSTPTAIATQITTTAIETSNPPYPSNSPSNNLSSVSSIDLSNDSLLSDDSFNSPSIDTKKIAQLCSQEYGLGADGLILIKTTTVQAADFNLAIYNANGSIAEMCGNAVRCVAKYLYDNRYHRHQYCTFDTAAGLIRTELIENDTTTALVRVNMGKPRVASADFVAQDSPASAKNCLQRFQFNGRTGFFVSMGNPHAIIPMAMSISNPTHKQNINPQNINPQNINPQNTNPQNTNTQNINPQNINPQILTYKSS